MSIPITCPTCQKAHNAPDSLAGRAAKCKCGAVLRIPAVSPPAQAPSLFDELSQADIARVQSAPRSPAAEATSQDNPYRSPAAAQYLSHANGNGNREASRSIPWLKYSYILAGVWAVVLVIIFVIGVTSVANDKQSSRSQREARAQQIGRGLAQLALIGWAPAIFLSGRWLMTKLAG